MNFSRIVAAAAISLMAASGAARASTITTIVDFNGLNGNLTNEVIGDYLFSTLNVQSSTTCAVPSCIQEYTGQGSITTMTRVDGGMFSLESFYFSLQGIGQHSTNDVNVISNTGETYKYALGDNDSDGATGGDVYLYDNPNDTTGADLAGADVIAKSNGSNGPNYVVFYSGTDFDDVTSINWFSTDTANTRIDNITVTAMSPVPLPAAGWMLLAGLGGLAAMRRRKS